MREWADSCAELQLRQGELDPSRQHAVIAWIGYEAPPSPSEGNFSVLSNALARQGAENLNHALNGISSASGGATINVVAHSYGSTTASIALSESDLRVDSFVAIGSAGFPTEINEAHDLNAERVFAGEARAVVPLPGARGDAWAWIGRTSDHPVDPTHPLFGATTFDVDGGEDGAGVTQHVTTTPDGTGYLDRMTQSLTNVARATVGRGSEVSPAGFWLF